MKSIHTFDVFAPTDEQEEAMNKKRGGHYRRGKNKEMDYFIECATSLFPNNHYSRFTPIYDTTKEFYQLITSSDTTERAILNWIASNRAWNYLFGLLRHYYRTGHHDDNYIFPEFKIGSAYVADYLLIGNSSDGYQFVFVELEAPNGRITKEKGTRFGEVINKGIEQVRDWQNGLSPVFARNRGYCTQPAPSGRRRQVRVFRQYECLAGDRELQF